MIRPLLPADAAAYFALRLEGLRLFPDAFGSDATEWAVRPLHEIANNLRATSESPDDLQLGAFVEAKLVGSVTFIRETRIKTRHSAHIYGMIVLPDYQNRGLGKQLMIAVLEKAKTLTGLEQIQLSVATTNTTAIKLYESCGFQTVGVEPHALKVEGHYVDLASMMIYL